MSKNLIRILMVLAILIVAFNEVHGLEPAKFGEQCGGNSWKGTTTCEENNSCCWMSPEESICYPYCMGLMMPNYFDKRNLRN